MIGPDEDLHEIVPSDIILFSSAMALAHVFDGGSATEAILAEPACESGAVPSRRRDPLCRVGRRGSVPECACARDEQFRQRCAFTFSDLFVKLLLDGAAQAGEKVDVEWSLLPWALASGEYWLQPELLVDRKWVPAGAKEKLGGKLAEGKEARTRFSFTMPDHPTILRTRLFHLPTGAKKPIESKIDTRVALRRPRLQEPVASSQ